MCVMLICVYSSSSLKTIPIQACMMVLVSVTAHLLLEAILILNLYCVISRLEKATEFSEKA